MARTSGPFEILEVLGDGAFGAVFVARLSDDPLKRLVAIKVLKAEYVSNPKVLHRTRDEARLLSKLHHPNIVRVEKLIEVAGRPVLVMELVQGASLKRLLVRAPNGLPVSVAMECIRQSAVALLAAYQAVGDDGRPMRVIHRDIKPSNMLLSIHGQLKVVDFGIATGQFQERESHTESVVMGSRPYMAPERLDGASDTSAVDIYSLGMSLLELITGRALNLSINPTHHERTLAECLADLRPDGLAEDGLEDLRNLMRRMCAYDADHRPEAREASSELERLLDGMDSAYRVSLEQYARDVVDPLFWRRRQIPLSEALHNIADGELITGVFGGRADDLGRGDHRWWTRMGWRPAVFLGAIAGMTLGTSLIAYNKYRRTAVIAAQSGDMVDVRVWMPSDAQARVGSQALAVPGRVRAPPGANVLELMFADGRAVSCDFEAKAGVAVRYVVERGGRAAVSINDGPADPCSELSAAEPEPQPGVADAP